MLCVYVIQTIYNIFLNLTVLGTHRAAFADDPLGNAWNNVSMRLLKAPSTAEAKGPGLDDVTPQKESFLT